MNITIIDKRDLKITHFITKMNAAFEKRSTDKIPFKPLSINELEDEIIYALFDDEKMVGGCTVRYMFNKIAQLRHVWIDVEKQGKGYASILIDSIEDIVKNEGYIELQLSVVREYAPAYNLYKKKGFKTYSYSANMPGQYCMVDMIKYLDKTKKVAFNLKCTFRLIVSAIKYRLLFTNDSRPKILHRIIFRHK